MSRDTYFRSYSIFRSAQVGTTPRSYLAVLLPIVGIIGTEGLLYAGYVGYATGGNLLLLFAFALGFHWFDAWRPILGAFVLLPVFRLVNLGMPVLFDSRLLWVFFVYAAILVGLYPFVRRGIWRGLNSAHDVRQYAVLVPSILVASALLGALEYEILRPSAPIQPLNGWNLLFIAIVMLAVVAPAEELIFRGILQRVLQGGVGRWYGILLAGLIYGVMHAGYGIAELILFTGAVGVALGFLYDRTNDFGLVVLIHGLTNVFLFAVYPFAGPPL